jgi:hypothetical protein
MTDNSAKEVDFQSLCALFEMHYGGISKAKSLCYEDPNRLLLREDPSDPNSTTVMKCAAQKDFLVAFVDLIIQTPILQKAFLEDYDDLERSCIGRTKIQFYDISRGIARRRAAPLAPLLGEASTALSSEQKDALRVLMITSFGEVIDPKTA